LLLLAMTFVRPWQEWQDGLFLAVVIQYPLTVISDGQAHDVFEFPISPAELKAKTGWHTTVDAEIDVVACLKGRLMSS
jgi:hypothetical protein